MTDQVCAGCRQIITDDPSGLCEDCQSDVLSQRPGSVTDEQRMTLAGLLMDQGLIGNWSERARIMASVLTGWTGSDLGGLSQQQAGDLLEALEERRLSQEARRL